MLCWWEWSDLPTIIALLYYMNPITIIESMISVNLQNVVTYLILQTLCHVTNGTEIPSKVYLSFVLSILTYIDVHYTILLVPILTLLIQPIIPQEQALHPPRNNDTRTGVIISTVVLYIKLRPFYW
jgi:GPI transamidase subunit PIG-U